MNLTVLSHKPCWSSSNSSTGYASDGGFPFQMQALSELFNSTTLVLPCQQQANHVGETPLEGHHIRVVPLTFLAGRDHSRKLRFPFWLLRNLYPLGREVWRADAIHAPIPGDIGTVGMLLAVAFNKPLFVRHCGNWFKPRTRMEHFWRWFMERFAGGRNVMLATGGQPSPPSSRNPSIQWIFASSLSAQEIAAYAMPRHERYATMRPRLIIVCRQERDKGTGMVLDCMPYLIRSFPNIKLDIVGDGSALSTYQQQTQALGLQQYVRFYGKVGHARVIELLQQADLFCYPTMASEGFPKVVLEALACGLPVVTTHVSVLPHLIRGQCGVILEEVSPRAVAETVEACLIDESAYRAMSVKALEVAKDYSLEAWRDRIGHCLQTAWGSQTRHG